MTVFVDLTLTSPPYDDMRDYHDYSFDVEKVAGELFRVTKKGGVVVWVVSDKTSNGSESGTSFKQALTFMAKGFRLMDTMIFKKNLLKELVVIIEFIGKDLNICLFSLKVPSKDH